jgi:uncharacterized protein
MLRWVPIDAACTAAGLVLLLAIAPAAAWAEAPSFDCSGVEAGSIEELVCTDAELSALDRRLAEVYAAASAEAINEHPPVLQAEQRGWIKGRDGCWKSEEVRGCVVEAYRLRIAELQARYGLVPMIGPVTYQCGGQPANEVVVTYFQTDPPAAIVERGEESSLMYRQPAASGSRYQGQNESFWEHHGEATLTWGYDGPELHCTIVEPKP